MKTQIDIGGCTYCLIAGIWAGPDLRAVPFWLSRRLWRIARRPALLMVANWDSAAGYAWWLMESYWRVLAGLYSEPVIAYPSISIIPDAIAHSRAVCAEMDFTPTGSLLGQCRFIRAHRIGTVYLTDQPVRSWRYAIWRMAGVHTIITHDHTPGLRTAPSGIKRLAKTLLNRLPWIVADTALGATDFVRDRLIEVACMPIERCHTIPNGLPQLDVDPIDVRTEFDIPADRVILVSTGRAAPIKNLDFALRLVAAVQGVHFLHVGDGPDLPRLRALASQLGIADRVTWAGRRSDVPALLPGCDIAIQPSRGEVGYSLSILEYMRAGLPVIVPDNRSVCGATAHGVNGLIYREGDLQSARTALLSLAKSPALRLGLGGQGQIDIAERFSLEYAHARLRSVFSEMSR